MKVLIIEDDSGIVDSLNLLFKMRWPEVEFKITSKGETGLLAVEQWNPDLTVLDLGLPDIDGLEVLKRIRLFSLTPVIILTARGDEYDIVRGLELGADDYIVKPFKQLEFLARAKTVLRHQGIAPVDAVYAKGPFKLTPATHKLYFDNREIILTKSECIIFLKLLENANSVVTQGALSRVLWGDDLPESVEAIRVYISRIRQKIEQNDPELAYISTKPGIGYSLNLSR
ncbi:response regulator transcription factor [Dehalogenimonas etheniformans]|uniref:DNA-binding response regulator n=1 Tax=Dehalogenimonas etheniformans TaxID=1536648 RepID=A0A2P5PAB6_9CHLR|nr:response regulator transcription factor [Dehalogenimonas etheniformans]PPD59224.1 DNA-binding response regulator [Dehalogenimonas etheniformans]QNT75734.1 response regulator transcription factor [Dehalogenimonas etheniformans]